MESDWLVALPKVSLHCHLEGTLASADYRRLAAKYDVDLGERAERSDENFYAFTSFIEFLMTFRDVCRLLREPDDYAMLTRAYLSRASAEGMVAAEFFVSPAAWRRLHPDLDVEAAFASIAAAIAAFPQLHVRLICDITRNFGVEIAETTLETALAMRRYGIIGVGLGGDEANYPAELFDEVFAAARRQGLRVVAHAGEAAGAESVRAAVEVLGAERIGHGIRAVDDPSVMRLLAERNIAVEQSPGSNARTGLVVGEHPIRRFAEAGVRVAVDADDPALFGTSLLGEYEALFTAYGASFVVERARDAVAASFMTDAEKSVLLARIEAHVVNLPPEYARPKANRSS